MPKIPPIKGGENIADTVLFVIAFALAGTIIYIYLHWLKNRSNKGTDFIREVQRNRPEADEGSRFIAAAPVVNNLSGTMAFSAGQNLTVTFPEYEHTIESTIINISAESFVITLPRDSDFTPKNGDSANFHTIKDGRNNNFTTSVLQIFTGGLRACAFRHTDNIEVTDRRSKTRVSGETAAVFSFIPSNLIKETLIPLADVFHNTQAYIPASIHDISIGGCALRTRSPLQICAGDLLGMFWNFPDSDEEFFAIGGVISSSKQPRSQGGGSIICIEFLAQEEETKTEIERYIHNTIENEVIE